MAPAACLMPTAAPAHALKRVPHKGGLGLQAVLTKTSSLHDARTPAMKPTTSPGCCAPFRAPSRRLLRVQALCVWPAEVLQPSMLQAHSSSPKKQWTLPKEP